MINAIKEEIQRQLQESEERLSHIKARGWVAPNEEQLIVHLKSLLSFIDTLEVKEVGISTHSIDDTLKEEGIDPDSKEAKVFKETYFTTLEKFKTQEGE